MTRRDTRGRSSWRTAFGGLLAVLTLGAAAALTGCASSGDAMPRCTDPLRLAIVAQSVPSASYLPCIRDLPPGWTTSNFAPAQDGTRFLLISDRSPAEPVVVELATACRFRFSGASPSPARAPEGKKYAVVVGVNEYTGGVPDLAFAENDAEALDVELKKAGFTRRIVASFVRPPSS